MKRYDLAIIGSGPCGYVSAIRAGQLGMEVCVFEGGTTGGVCLNRGCIPTKVLSESSSVLYGIERSGEFGIDLKGCEIDFLRIRKRKDAIVKRLVHGVEMLLKAKKIELIKETAEIKGPGHIVTNKVEIEANSILIASGSLPLEIQGMEFDGEYIISSSDMLGLEKIPKSIVIIGGGVMGCEFASIFSTFGSEITMVEMMEHLLPNEDAEIAGKIEQIFKKKGIRIFTKTKVEKIDKTSDGVNVGLSNGESVPGEKALIAVGRAPNSRALGLDALGVENNNGWIKVDRNFRTSISNIYAAGDVTGGVLLAHVASREGICAVEAMQDKEGVLDYNVVPNCIFTHPEIATVGLSEKKAKDNGLDARSRKFLFSALGKAHILGELDGFVKIVVDNASDKILGAQIIGPHATELIAELTVCVQFGITSEKLAGVIHAHPTLSEVIQEASEALHNRAIHAL